MLVHVYVLALFCVLFLFLCCLYVAFLLFSFLIFSSTCLITDLVTYLPVLLILVGSLAIRMLCTVHSLMEERQYCLRVYQYTLIQVREREREAAASKNNLEIKSIEHENQVH